MSKRKLEGKASGPPPAPAAPTAHEFEQVSCPVCTDMLRQRPHASAPHALTCGHTLCGGCATKAVEASPRVCPVCGNPVEDAVPNDALGAFCERVCTSLGMSANAPVSLMAASLPAPLSCEDCARDDTDTPGQFACETCDARTLCDLHVLLHQRRNHATVRARPPLPACPRCLAFIL